MKGQFREKGLDAILISLDVKKPFDSVSHKYVEKILKKYGYGQTFMSASRR
jgi:hypothetical protein